MLLLLSFLLTLSASSMRVSASQVNQRSDDVPALAAVVQQQSAAIQTMQSQLAAQQSLITSLQQSVTSLQTPIQKDHEKQVVFQVQFSGHWNEQVDVGPHGTVKFNSAISNYGHAYNTETGIFTAPYAGTYVFILAAMHVPDSTTNSQLYIKMTGGRGLTYTFGNAASQQPNGYTRDVVDTAVHMNVGDQVWVEHAYGGTVFRQGAFTSFTGFLVQYD